MKLFLLSITLFFCTLTSSALTAAPAIEARTNAYTMQDLQALSKSNQWDEFLDHIYDIRPSLRNDKWAGLIKINFSNHLKHLLKHKLFRPRLLTNINKLIQLEFVQADEIIQILSNDFVKGVMHDCLLNFQQNTSVQCLKNIQAYWKLSKKDEELGLYLGQRLPQLIDKFSASNKRAHATMISSTDIWQYYVPAVDGKFGDIHCSVKSIQEVVINKLFTVHAADKSAPLNFTYFSRGCWTKLKPRIEKLLISNNKLNRDVAYKILNNIKEKKEIDELTYRLTYLLNSPAKGDELNESWNMIIKASKDSNLRDQMIKRLDKLAFLPDEVLKKQQSGLTAQIYKLLDANFPEFIDYYYKECLEYYTESRGFPNGTRTINCLKFIDMNKREKVLTTIQYNKIIKALPFKL
jgi:hypothetical protein